MSKQTPLPLDSGTKSRGSLEEIIAFCLSIDLLQSDGEYFYYLWDGNGWKNGRQPIKNWQSVIRCWKAAGYCPSQKQKPQQFTKPSANVTLIAHQKEWDRVMERMRVIKGGYDHYQTWSKKDTEEYAALKTRKEELKKLLGITV